MSTTSKDRISVIVKKKPRIMVNQSNLASRSLDDMIDVDTSEKSDGSLLIYDETSSKFKTSKLLEKQIINGGHF